MIYTDATKKALLLAFEAHNGQKDKAGLPYICHPLHVAEQMTDEDSAVTALLHDVAEDTEVSLADIAAAGFKPDVMHALALLTHDKAVPYLDYVRALAPDPLARRVKMADIRHNMDDTRLGPLSEAARQRRLDKYAPALALLEQWEAQCREEERHE